MKINFTTYRMSPTDTQGNKEVSTVISSGNVTLLCTMIFDDDEASDTYDHWVCKLEYVSDTEDVADRSLTVYPNTLHFDGDDRYVIAITSELKHIGIDDLTNAFITVGEVVNE